MSIKNDDKFELLCSAINSISDNARPTESERLTSGLSGAIVWQCEIRYSTDRILDGRYVVKAVPTSDHQASNVDNSFLQLEVDARKFVKKYVAEPALSGSYDHGGYSFRFYQDTNLLIDGGAVPLSDVVDDSLRNVVKHIAEVLLPIKKRQATMNPNWPCKNIPLSPKELLHSWIQGRLKKDTDGYGRLLEVRNRLRGGFTNNEDIRYIKGIGSFWPDPLYIIENVINIRQSITTMIGWTHSDLHLGNIHVSGSRGARKEKLELRIIDFDSCRKVPLFYDHSYMKLALLLSKDNVPDEHLLTFFRKDENKGKGLSPDLSICSEAVAAIEDVVQKFPNGDARNKNVILEQAILADIAAALDWAGKKVLAPNLRDRAYLFASMSTCRYGNEILGHNWKTEKLPEPRRLDRGLGNESTGKTNSKDITNVKHVLPGQLLVNAFLQSEYQWHKLIELLGLTTLKSLCNGDKIESKPALKALFKLITKENLFQDLNTLQCFLGYEGSTQLSLDELLELISEGNSPLSKNLKKLIKNKKIFDDQKWIEGSVKQELKLIREWKNEKISLLLRSNMLRKAYYLAGISMTSEEMADAAIADFSDYRWLKYFNFCGPLSNDDNSRKHLNTANNALAQYIFERLPPAIQGRDTAIIEGGVGGGNTTFYVLRMLKNRDISRCIKYLGIELVPSLACSLNYLMENPSKFNGDLANELEALTNESHNKTFPRIVPLLPDYPFIKNGKMEAIVEEIAESLKNTEGIDAFFTSFAFHHVPNGNAIKSFIAGDSPNLNPSLANHKNSREIAKAFAEATKKYFENFVTIRDNGATVKGISESCASLLQSYKDKENYVQVRVFLSLLNVGALNPEDINLFCTTIEGQLWYPREALDRMLHNPQLELLLTVQSMLRDGGVIAIADPDGMSDFNAEFAASDPELTIANFMSSVTLAKMLEEIGFTQLECFEVHPPRNDVESDQVSPVFRDSLDMDLARVRPPKGYIILARRSQATEREMSYNRRLNSGSSPLQFKSLINDESLVRVGKECARNDSGVDRVITDLLNPADPLPRSPQLFRNLPKLHSDLTSLGFIENCGGYIVAGKRAHRFPIPEKTAKNSAPKNVTIFTDLPPTPHDLRKNRSLVFSYSDEAIVLLDEIEKALSPFQKKNLRILDCCAGAGTLGILAKAFCPEAQVVFTDSGDKSIEQIRQNLIINNMDDPEMMIVEKTKTDNSKTYIWPSKTHGPFDIILADPPFALRPQDLRSNIQIIDKDDGGMHGDNFSGRILREAPDWLTENGQLVILAYTLIEQKKGTNEYKRSIDKHTEKLDGSFKPVTTTGPGGYVMRYRHDKIAKNCVDVGMPLDFVMLRLGDTTRPESIVYESPKRARHIFSLYREWLEGLRQEGYVGLQYVMGTFRAKKIASSGQSGRNK